MISSVVYLVTDLALGGEWFDRICKKGSYIEQDAENIIRTVCDAVAYLHDNAVVHRGNAFSKYSLNILLIYLYLDLKAKLSFLQGK